MTKEELRNELSKFAKNLIDGYVDDTTVLELLGTSDVIDDYVDNQLKYRWIKDCKRSKKSSIDNQPYDLNNAPGFRKSK